MIATVKASHINMRSCFLYIHSLLLNAHYITLFHSSSLKAVTLKQHLYEENVKHSFYSSLFPFKRQLKRKGHWN